MILKLLIKKFFSFSLSLIFIFLFSLSYTNASNINRIELLVNENAITNYDIVQRMKINAILRKIEIDNENYNQLINAVIDDLITERLKYEKIIEYKISFDSKEFENHERRFYSSIEYEKEKLKELFTLNEINYDYLADFIEIELKWQKLIYGLFLRVTPQGTKQWVQRITINGKRTEIGLGSAIVIPLSMARKNAIDNYISAKSGQNPLPLKINQYPFPYPI